MAASFRLVLVGHEWMDTTEVFNLLLGRDRVEMENSSAKNYNTGFTGFVLNRCITMVSTADLFTSDISDDDLKQKVKECVSLCAPGPHALLLVINPEDFDEEKRKKLENIVTSFSEEAFQHSIVFTYEEQSQHKALQKIITGCGGRIYQYSEEDQASALNAIENMISQNSWSYITCDETTEMDSNGQKNEDGNDGESHNVMALGLVKDFSFN